MQIDDSIKEDTIKGNLSHEEVQSAHFLNRAMFLKENSDINSIQRINNLISTVNSNLPEATIKLNQVQIQYFMNRQNLEIVHLGYIDETKMPYTRLLLLNPRGFKPSDN